VLESKSEYAFPPKYITDCYLKGQSRSLLVPIIMQDQAIGDIPSQNLDGNQITTNLDQ
jgi:hypothetical protein